jgi:hypothetical protein
MNASELRGHSEWKARIPGINVRIVSFAFLFLDKQHSNLKYGQ